MGPRRAQRSKAASLKRSTLAALSSIGLPLSPTLFKCHPWEHLIPIIPLASLCRMAVIFLFLMFPSPCTICMEAAWMFPPFPRGICSHLHPGRDLHGSLTMAPCASRNMAHRLLEPRVWSMECVRVHQGGNGMAQTRLRPATPHTEHEDMEEAHQATVSTMLGHHTLKAGPLCEPPHTKLGIVDHHLNMSTQLFFRHHTPITRTLHP